MPKNFDELLKDDLSFILGGETFTMQYVKPEVMAAWEDSPDPETAQDSIEDADERIKLFLLPGDAKRYEELRANEEAKVTSHQLNALLRWMVEVQTGRPTVTASDSQPGPGSTEASSTAPSPSRAQRRSARPPARRR